MSQFDAGAREWDSKPEHWERSKAIAKVLLETVSFKPEGKALEFGAGTGILSFLLESRFSEIILMDSSRGMVEVMNEKVSATGLTHLKPLFFDLETEEYSGSTFDIVYSQMVMHHVADIAGVTERFFHLLNPGGWLAIADLYKEDGSFHGEGFTGHKGFDTGEFQEILERAGFHRISVKPCFVVKKLIEGSPKEFPVFLMTARKR